MYKTLPIYEACPRKSHSNEVWGMMFSVYFILYQYWFFSPQICITRGIFDYVHLRTIMFDASWSIPNSFVAVHVSIPASFGSVNVITVPSVVVLWTGRGWAWCKNYKKMWFCRTRWWTYIDISRLCIIILCQYKVMLAFRGIQIQKTAKGKMMFLIKKN